MFINQIAACDTLKLLANLASIMTIGIIGGEFHPLLGKQLSSAFLSFLVLLVLVVNGRRRRRRRTFG